MNALPFLRNKSQGFHYSGTSFPDRETDEIEKKKEKGLPFHPDL